MERTDLKPYCLLLETKDKRYHLQLKSDEELYGWQDDVYSRSPLMGVSNPTNFVHKIHVGFDPVSGAFTVSGNTTPTPSHSQSADLVPYLGPPGAMDSAPNILGNHPRGLCQESTSRARRA